MPLTYTIDAVEGLVTITGEYAQPEEWLALLSGVATDEQYRAGLAFLRDLRDATTPVDAATVVKIMEVVRRFWPRLQPSCAAILTPRPFDPAALVAHAVADAERMPIQVFTSHEEALRWIRECRRGPSQCELPIGS